MITYEDANRAVRALLALREAKMDEKHLLGKKKLLTDCVKYSSFGYG